MIDIRLGDCLEAMRLMDTNSFDLAIVDPPYGIGMGSAMSSQTEGDYRNKFDQKNWDNEIPTKEYFDQLKRVSKNQIIWGGNYMTDHLGPTKSWIVWDKNNGASLFGDGELAWSSFDKPLQIKRIHWVGSASLWEDTGGKIHPTQKPVSLYTWLLDRYAKPNDRILDTHLGSGSISIACYNLGYDLTGYELDSDYYKLAMKRLENHQKQLRLF